MDGVEVPDDIAGDFEGVGGGPMGGGSPSGVAFGCVDWMACEGKTFALNQNNQIVEYQMQYGLLSTYTSAAGYYKGKFTFYQGDRWGYRLVATPASESCGLDLVCDFYDGFTNLFVNGRASGALQLGGSLAVGVALGALGPPAETIGNAVSATTDAISGLPNIARETFISVYTNPSLIEALQQIGSGLNLAGVPSATWWGIGAYAAAELYGNWGTITGWFGH